jgi:hypothetical protein
LLLLVLPSLALVSSPTYAQAQGTWTASFGVNGSDSATGTNFTIVGHFSFTLSNLTGSSGIYLLLATFSTSCNGRFIYNNTVAYQATYNSGTNLLSFSQLSAGMPSAGYVAYGCSVGTGSVVNNYMTETPFKASPFNISLASGTTVPISGKGYFGQSSGSLVLLSGTTVVSSFSATATSSSTTTSGTFSFTLNTSTASSTESTGSSSSGGGIPEFPSQATAVAVFTVLILAMYLVVRRSGRPA